MKFICQSFTYIYMRKYFMPQIFFRFAEIFPVFIRSQKWWTFPFCKFDHLYNSASNFTFVLPGVSLLHFLGIDHIWKECSSSQKYNNAAFNLSSPISYTSLWWGRNSCLNSGIWETATTSNILGCHTTINCFPV